MGCFGFTSCEVRHKYHKNPQGYADATNDDKTAGPGRMGRTVIQRKSAVLELQFVDFVEWFLAVSRYLMRGKLVSNWQLGGTGLGFSASCKVLGHKNKTWPRVCSNGAEGFSPMISLQDLWTRLRLAQQTHNVDAALCFRHAIEAYARCDYPSVLFWFREAQICEPNTTFAL
jgi:hypothetical protein